MIEIALTGGIGSGKSTVADAFVDRGAELIDADRIVRELQEPGQPVFEAMVQRWGAGSCGSGRQAESGCGSGDRLQRR